MTRLVIRPTQPLTQGDMSSRRWPPRWNLRRTTPVDPRSPARAELDRSAARGRWVGCRGDVCGAGAPCEQAHRGQAFWSASERP